MGSPHYSVRALAIGLFSMLAVAQAQAQTIYRCGNNYSGSPCPQGVIVNTADPRSQAQKAQTDHATADAKALSGQMERNRRADEAAAQHRADSQAKAAAQKAKTDQMAKTNSLRAEAKAKKKPAKTKMVKLANSDKPRSKPAREPANSAGNGDKAGAAAQPKL